MVVGFEEEEGVEEEEADMLMRGESLCAWEEGRCRVRSVDEGAGSREVRIKVKGGGERRSMYKITKSSCFCLQYASRSTR